MPSPKKASKVLELLGTPTTRPDVDWKVLVKEQPCHFLNRTCLKVRKSRPEISIGTCTVMYGKAHPQPVIICPHRLLERKQVFNDCLKLLTNHETGNELHIVREIEIPGGSVDYFLASVRDKKVHDFVGIEFQTMDTTGTVWPERQRFLKSVGMTVDDSDIESTKPFGMNWKMTAKTILMQLHHKVQTFEHIHKHFVLVIQDHFLEYTTGEFNFSGLHKARLGDPMQVHSYLLRPARGIYKLVFKEAYSTDSAGVAQCLGLQADANMELETVLKQIEAKISDETTFNLEWARSSYRATAPTSYKSPLISYALLLLLNVSVA